jgi:hypothetical protein
MMFAEIKKLFSSWLSVSIFIFIILGNNHHRTHDDDNDVNCVIKCVYACKDKK